MSPFIRPSPFAGTWYPRDPGELARLVASQLEEAPPTELDGELSALVSPHAGLVYSGPVAAAGYRLLMGSAFETVLLLGPSHRVLFEALAVFPSGAFETPLGAVEVDEELASAFLEHPEARPMPEVHADEHCLEMQLPFLQAVLPGCRIVPVMMGRQDRRHVEAAAKAISGALGARRAGSVLIVASSDLSHYESRERARALDASVVESLEAFDVDRLGRVLDEDSRHACGGGPILSVMSAARALGADRSRVLRYGDSGDVSGDVSAVVGYVSAAMYRESNAA